MATDSRGYEPELPWLITRPTGGLMDLPIAARWEVTRRHPYYQLFWEAANRSPDGPEVESVSGQLRDAARLILLGIGISGDPPDPRGGLDALEIGQLGGAWEGGAVAPATCRSLLSILMLSAPAATRREMGQLLLDSATVGDADQADLFSSVRQLAESSDPALSAVINASVVSLNLQAPQTAIVEAVEQLVRDEKRRRNIPERRRRHDKIDEYLHVWDQREGWHDGRYEGAREKQLIEVARESATALDTVASRYKTAFRLITGHDYSPERWLQLFGIIKLSRIVAGDNEPRVALRRPWHSRNRDLASAERMLRRSPRSGADFVERAGISRPEIELLDLAIDIQSLIELGRTDGEITAELELTGDAATEYIHQVRARQVP